MDTMRFWDALRTPPESALKPIQAGRLKGKTDINPQWRMQAMTEAFGPCGIGWYYTIDRLWTEQGSDRQVAAFALISLYYRDGETWSDPIPGIGGSMLVENESKGPHTSDEAYKMAVTDALSVAMKALGLAADVYLGQVESKYARPEPRAQESAPDNRPATEKQRGYLFRLASERGVKDAVEKRAHELQERYGFIPAAWASSTIDRLMTMPKQHDEYAEVPPDQDDSPPHTDDDIPF